MIGNSAAPYRATRNTRSQSAQPTSLPQVLDPGPSKPEAAHDDAAVEAQHTELRPLTSLKWPYVPEESAYPDPLRRDDPKSLQLPQYEAIATSPAVRRSLASHPQLPALLRSLDQLRGPEREEALEHALGVAPPDPREVRTEDNTHALRELAEAVEAAVRGGKQDVLGLDWGD
ncbi:uncharacterized protein LAESUDRAFT_711338 [Laetiporus sulphureus 93-53]|uniref:Uncharacterized protein n=1 Tax=Laetiporus sulphureus 93-53 TaxID=1314785 RepID=A0A165GWI4_9APHY|nr:uncharacterized protein LAESUDRAFT_711338 [Laetiporus sulphureus 93-53]KZT10922.1 hypothetical protein LAESUDRAFT_711338 [Laetiporus sulphureus 93-53]